MSESQNDPKAINEQTKRLEDERWALMNSYGNSTWRDGAIRMRIEGIDRELMRLSRASQTSV